MRTGYNSSIGVRCADNTGTARHNTLLINEPELPELRFWYVLSLYRFFFSNYQDRIRGSLPVQNRTGQHMRQPYAIALVFLAFVPGRPRPPPQAETRPGGSCRANVT